MAISFRNHIFYLRIDSLFHKMLQNVCCHSREGQLFGPASLWDGWKLHVKVLWWVTKKPIPEIVQLNRTIIWPLLSVHTQRTPKLNSKSEQEQAHWLPERRERRSKIPLHGDLLFDDPHNTATAASQWRKTLWAGERLWQYEIIGYVKYIKMYKIHCVEISP